MVRIGTDHIWDGGIVSKTQRQHLLDQDDKMNSLVFQVDLFSARGMLPRDIKGVLARHKELASSAGVARPPAITRSGAGACTTVSQVRQAYLGRAVRITRSVHQKHP